MSKILTKVFIGCPISPPLELQLEKSKSWKESAFENKDLEIVLYEGKRYIGLYVESKQISTEDLLLLSPCILERVAFYCPKFDTRTLAPKVFSQVFVQ